MTPEWLSQIAPAVLLVLVGLLLGMGVNLAADALKRSVGPAREHADALAPSQHELPAPPSGAVSSASKSRRWNLWRWILVELACCLLLSSVWLPQVGWRLSHIWLADLFPTLHLLVLLLVTVTDIEQRRIPNVVIYPAITVVLLVILLDPSIEGRSALIGGVVGALAFMLLYLLGWGYASLRHETGAALGAGDVKLAAYIGLITGWPGVALALTLGVLAGGIAGAVAILIRLAQKRHFAGVSMAYGPYLALGAAMVLLLMP